jgi:GABA permease
MPDQVNAHAGGAELQRGLHQRHMTMIAIGGVIGAGLFVGSGVVIGQIGPAAVLTYLLTGLFIVLVMRMLGEMATAYPHVGSFSELCRKALGNWAGFTVGWLYWYFWVIVIAFEAVAGAKVLGRWVHLPLWVMSLGLLLLLTLTNLGSVRAYGEFEFWFASIKVAAILAFLAIGTLFVVGLWPGHSLDFSNLTAHGGFFPKGILAVFSGIVIVVFSMVGAEIVTVAAAESDQPGRAIAKATNSVIVRILVFYVGSVFLLVTILPWNSTELGSSPYVSALAEIGVPGIADVMNAIVLTAVLSCLNSGIYTASRMIFALARRGDAPRHFLRVNKAGVPLEATLIATLVGYLSVGAAFLWPETLFTFLLNSSGAVVLFVYLLITVAELRMRRQLEREAPERLHVRMWLFPWLTLLAALAVVAILVSMYFTEGTRSQLLLSVVSLAFVLGVYWVRQRRAAPAVRPPERVPAAEVPAVAEAVPAAGEGERIAASRVLVVANETVGAPELLEELRRIEGEKQSSYLVVVPAQPPHTGDGTLWSPEPAYAAARLRLESTLQILREEGLDARGVIGDYRPLHAIKDAVREFRPDLIVISTHPEEHSNWLRQNIVQHVQRTYDIPVHHVVSRVASDVFV